LNVKSNFLVFARFISIKGTMTPALKLNASKTKQLVHLEGKGKAPTFQKGLFSLQLVKPSLHLFPRAFHYWLREVVTVRINLHSPSELNYEYIITPFRMNVKSETH